MRQIYLLVCLLLLSACSYSKAANDMNEVYSLALESYMSTDEALNDQMQFIAIDFKNKDLNNADKEKIITYLKKYNVDVFEATFDQLKQKGLFDPKNLVLKGVLLAVEKTQISANKVVVTGSKYRSGDGAVGMKVIVERKHGKWKVTRSDMTWIS